MRGVYNAACAVYTDTCETYNAACAVYTVTCDVYNVACTIYFDDRVD